MAAARELAARLCLRWGQPLAPALGAGLTAVPQPGRARDRRSRSRHAARTRTRDRRLRRGRAGATGTAHRRAGSPDRARLPRCPALAHGCALHRDALRDRMPSRRRHRMRALADAAGQRPSAQKPPWPQPAAMAKHRAVPVESRSRRAVPRTAHAHADLVPPGWRPRSAASSTAPMCCAPSDGIFARTASRLARAPVAAGRPRRDRRRRPGGGPARYFAGAVHATTGSPWRHPEPPSSCGCGRRYAPSRRGSASAALSPPRPPARGARSVPPTA